MGNPDFAFPESRLAVFIDGCFWHGCGACYREPKSNQEYWKLKVQRNRKRDDAVTQTLTDQGWRVLRVWEHEVVTLPDDVIEKVVELLAKENLKSTEMRPRKSNPSQAHHTLKEKSLLK
jgi:DNA mismatch endonuclease (patch repair protein)